MLHKIGLVEIYAKYFYKLLYFINPKYFYNFKVYRVIHDRSRTEEGEEAL